MIAHNPGPWAIDQDSRTGDLTVETEHDPVSIARVCHQDPQADGGRDFDIERANGRLIAAAPELLTECREAVAFFSRGVASLGNGEAEDRELMKQINARLDGMRTAISKAEGRT